MKTPSFTAIITKFLVFESMLTHRELFNRMPFCTLKINLMHCYYLLSLVALHPHPYLGFMTISLLSSFSLGEVQTPSSPTVWGCSFLGTVGGGLEPSFVDCPNHPCTFAFYPVVPSVLLYSRCSGAALPKITPQSGEQADRVVQQKGAVGLTT